ncbi:short-chain dehydrogenase/reductase [Philodulcilactobacillus myokoensis]|uniref:Short-chain dehydrogenase/reductase n=1 Tax=Philodulcilactobacillus myokoensis TaxID=2929573 RepID=A0A9W6ES76_9LACO|nr:oxidoreductase [Philodulcilactobacillus myokoensis]GLB46088.1 short-chain dehydrogenase/reductase [Philodulcilactobacillus myokoensis]
MKNKVVLITGASSGIGYQTAKVLSRNGYKVYGGARRVEKIKPLKKFGVRPLKLDVTQSESVKNAINTIIAKEHSIYGLVNNAGYGSYGAIENVSISEAKKQMEVNVFGMIRIIKMVLPYMRKEHSGKIINISSIGGRVVSYFGGWYHASKYSVEALSDAIRMETKPFGIKVSLIEPGGIKTNWGHIAANHLIKSSQNTPYQEAALKAGKGMDKQYNSKMLSNPMVVSKRILKAMNSNHPRTRYVMGFGSKSGILLHSILPTPLFDFMMMHMS